MKCTFIVGQKVVCINDSDFMDHIMNEMEPKAGVIYTIRDVILTSYGIGVRLNEIHNTPRHCLNYDNVELNETCFKYERFRSLKNIEIIKEMLTVVPSELIKN